MLRKILICLSVGLYFAALAPSALALSCPGAKFECKYKSKDGHTSTHGSIYLSQRYKEGSCYNDSTCGTILSTCQGRHSSWFSTNYAEFYYVGAWPESTKNTSCTQ